MSQYKKNHYCYIYNFILAMRAGWLTSNPVSTKEDITCSLSDDSGSTVKIQISIFCVDTHPLSHCNPCRAHIKKCSDTPFFTVYDSNGTSQNFEKKKKIFLPLQSLKSYGFNNSRIILCNVNSVCKYIQIQAPNSSVFHPEMQVTCIKNYHSKCQL